jgi:DNA helicase-2/ATP-dependent DNA helicase PcrA
LPSRFVDELPETFVEVAPMANSYGGYGLGSYGGSRFEERQPFANTYATPGWQRAQQAYARGEGMRSTPRILEGELVARETEGGGFAEGDRVFHQKFGNGRVIRVDGNKLTIDFDKAGEKRVIDSFVERI